MIEQLELFDARSPLPALPPLARLVRYYDDYDRQQRRLENLDSDVWRIHVNGGTSSWDYARFPEPARSVLTGRVANVVEIGEQRAPGM